MSYCKYIAAGFIDDAEKLYKDFAQCHNNDFNTFCEVWKKHKFGCIFMGRPDLKELREFTNEIFQLILNYMGSSSFLSQIAATYLLYALYRHQDVIPPVRIRISKLQFQIIQRIHVYAVKEKIYTLHYIIDYLKKNCLELVANCTLYGPYCSLNKDNPVKVKTNQSVVLSDLKQDMTIFQEKGVFTGLKNLRSQYLELKTNIISTSLAVGNNDSLTVNKEYETKINDLKRLLGGSKGGSNSTTNDRSELTVEDRESSSKPLVDKNNDIGRRRLEIKNAASQMKVTSSKSRYNNDVVLEQEPESYVAPSTADFSIKKKRSYNKRIPVNQRRVGRPRKYAKVISSDENESDDSDFKFSFQILPKVTKTKKGPLGRSKTSYLTNYEGPVVLASSPKPTKDNSGISDNESYEDELEF